ncbi:MAG TPA: phage terminase large subunit family protein [Amaricoccus sp.]|uniref:phage terminase large subunit family protein n=1 Tax=Amaricoccus sp. TaxID=1872485 RepID=UPI002BC83A62|nr:terminase gpA endonuclease subunit [Amaricoccus sp.]HMQ91517.1 phage terminase large subunit family protein [Amaricoccus sp.]HMR50936.1 phage terminase large subunit family protein [Amaricoccus sp.]HMR58893.1 phage terminase large subunit family protein [Amaricoccus sp.]HMT97885.1 phage terminase large subunit family protein [Amaricoccus sp.]
MLELRRETLALLRPPPRLDLGEWIESNISLPAAIAAVPGRVRLSPQQRGIARSMGDPDVPRVTVLKSARVGYSTLLGGYIAYRASCAPGALLAVLPAESDARTFIASLLEPIVDSSPAVRGVLDRDLTGRDNMTFRAFPGGNLRVVSAGAPRNLRAVYADTVIFDETDAFPIDSGGEGDPVKLAERRAFTATRPKLILGSTPVDEATSRVWREWQASDQRVFEARCPHCSEFAEITWSGITWLPDRPDTAFWTCPANGCAVHEGAEKRTAIEAGRWRATRPEVVGHHGYRLNALSSLLPAAAWPLLGTEWLEAKKAPETLRVFVNTLLGEVWRDADTGPDEHELAARAEPIGLDRMPAEILWLTAGVDVQDDRLEVAIVGHQRDGEAAVLAHRVLWGPIDCDAVWRDLDDLLRETWAHPTAGARIGIAAAAVDGSDVDHLPHVDAFCRGRFGRRVVRIKGAAGFTRAPFQRSTQKGAPWYIVGVDGLKAALLNRLGRPGMVRFSDSLGPEFFEQLCSEHLVTKYSRGRPVRRFERLKGARAEALDATVYALAVKTLIGQPVDAREAELATQAAPKPAPRVARSQWMER